MFFLSEQSFGLSEEAYMTALDEAIKRAGGLRPLGRAINVWPSQIHKWVNEYNGRVPKGEHVYQIYLATGITPHELRPDLYPNMSDGLSEHHSNTQSG